MLGLMELVIRLAVRAARCDFFEDGSVGLLDVIEFADFAIAFNQVRLRRHGRVSWHHLELLHALLELLEWGGCRALRSHKRRLLSICISHKNSFTTSGRCFLQGEVRSRCSCTVVSYVPLMLVDALIESWIDVGLAGSDRLIRLVCHICEIADLHLVHLSDVLVEILLWSVGHRRPVQCFSSIIVCTHGSSDLYRLQGVIILLIYEIFDGSLLEEVEGGLRRLASLNLSTVHRSLLVHSHI